MSKPKLSPAALEAAESAAARVTAREMRQAERKSACEMRMRKRLANEAAIEDRCRPKEFNDAQWILVWDLAREHNPNDVGQGLEDEIDAIFAFLDDLERARTTGKV